MEALRLRVSQINRAGGEYHKFDLGNNLIIDGDYDLYKYIDFYNIPRSLVGTTVLDVGTASGYLAVECARRGADVTAIDLWKTRESLHVACAAFGVSVRYLQRDLFDLDESFGKFDLVLCGSMLLHVASPLDAIRKLRALCKHRIILSTTSTIDSATTDRPVCEFLGIHATDGDYWNYWSISVTALRQMLRAGNFSTIEHEAHFVLATEPNRTQYISPHVVVSATI